MDSRRFVFLLASINLSILLLIGGMNFVIDADSSRHLPGEESLFPRTTNQNGLSKLHYITEKKPDVLFFGSSRVDIGLPAKHEYFAGKSVYNAGMQASSLGNTIPLIRHVLALYEPQVVVLGLDFVTFTSKPSSADLDMFILSSGIIEYRIKRFFHDIKRTLTIQSTKDSLHAIRAFLTGHSYDPIDSPMYINGQASDAEMERLTKHRGKNIEAFKWALGFAYGSSSEQATRRLEKNITEGLIMLDEFVALACAHKIQLRIFYNPRHALAEHALSRGREWAVLEHWKNELGKMATRYQSNCDFKIFDFSGYNSITSESVLGITATSGLNNYWEASHYKSGVGEMILKRLFSVDISSLPSDFGRELTAATSAEINSTVRREQKLYQESHAREIALVEKWLSHSGR